MVFATETTRFVQAGDSGFPVSIKKSSVLLKTIASND
jgi:hypothetical protein